MKKSMKNGHDYYKPRKKVYEGKNWSFCPETLYATSYGWWPMLTVIKGKIVRNTFNYSQSTTKHQSKLRSVLDVIGLKPDLFISVRASLHNLIAVKAELLSQWASHEVAIKYSRGTCHESSSLLKDVQAARIGIKFSKAEKAEALEQAEAGRRARLDRKKRLSYKASPSKNYAGHDYPSASSVNPADKPDREMKAIGGNGWNIMERAHYHISKRLTGKSKAMLTLV